MWAIVHEGERQRFTMTRSPLLTTVASLGLTVLMLSVISTPWLSSLEATKEILPAEGRQDLDVDCSGYSFEDLFEYDFALFELKVLDDWATGDMYANAWVNGSNSAIVRDNLDGLFEGLPGGDNDWISTDERDAVRSIGPKCIADMETRLGMREGIPHSGGVDWNDFEFVEEGIGLDEVNLVPQGHADARTCTNFGAAADCKEVPTSTTDDMEISLDVTAGETHNVRWDQLPNSGVSNFTLAMNITNMSNAALRVHFPVLQGLRMTDFRVTDNAPASGQTCDHINEPSFTYLGDGSLQVTQLVSFDRTQWDLECNMFMDFTTQEPASNDVPLWSSSAPSNGTSIPTSGAGTWRFATAEVGNAWASDENGWALQCAFDQADWTVSTNVLGDFFVTQPPNSDQATATCNAVDPLGASDENDTRTWTFGTLFSATATLDETGKNAIMSIVSQGLVNEFLFTVRASQEGVLGSPGDTATVSGTSATDIIVSLDNIRPGSFAFVGEAQATNMLDYTAEFDLGLTKPNSPPVVTVAVNFNGENATWDESQLKFSMYGLVSDPDLEAVTMQLTICGAEYQGFDINGINWDVEVSTAICMANGLTNYDVLIKATDDSGATTQVLVAINPPSVDEPPIDSPVPMPDEGSSLPAASLLGTMCMLGIAVLVGRRGDE
jgi:hypothetical protein